MLAQAVDLGLRGGDQRGARRLGRWIPSAGGALLLLVGGYVAYYGLWEIRVLGGAMPNTIGATIRWKPITFATP